MSDEQQQPMTAEELKDRCSRSIKMICRMCSEKRPPLMRIRGDRDDEDMFVIDTLKACLAEIDRLNRVVDQAISIANMTEWRGWIFSDHVTDDGNQPECPDLVAELERRQQ